MLELTLYVVVFIALSGLMATVEAAVLNVTHGEVEELRLQDAWGAEALKAITERMTQPVVVLVIFTNTVNVVGPILAGRKAIQLYGDVAIGILTAILTFGTLIFSYIIPKSLVSHYAQLFSRSAAPVIRVLIVSLYPLVVALEWLSDLLKSGKRGNGTVSQIRSLTDIGRREGYIQSDEGKLVQRAFLLNDKSAAEIMTPLKEAVTVQEGTSVKEAASRVFRHAYSRYPVFGKSQDEVIGLVMSRDILAALTEGKDRDPVSTICRPGLTVPADMRADKLLVRFRDAHIHLAVVQDNRRTIGLLTLEDVLEELVGEIEDEKDVLAGVAVCDWSPFDWA